MITIDFTAAIYTPESLEQGDHEAHGYFYPDWNSDPDMCDLIKPDDYERQQWKIGDLRHAINLAACIGISGNPDATSFYNRGNPCTINTIEKGYTYDFGFHIDGITESTRKRIPRVLGA